MRRFLLSAVSLIAAPVWAQDAPPPAASEAEDGAFELGKIVVTGYRSVDAAIEGDRVGQEAIYRFDRRTLDDAANLIPGVVAGNSGGSRNERLLFVRGFDRFQVPLSIDGIRVYLPADNRLDYGRFLTPDIAEIQVAKGYASVLDGPGGMGGAVNLVTRKPVKALEIEGRAQLNLDSDLDYGGFTGFGLVGTRQDKWYAQASYGINITDHWDLPGGFAPTANEDGGARDFSKARDWRVNAKIGFTPNDSDEYVLSYTRQEGRKNAPLHVTDTSNVSLRNWKWPEWNIESVYFLSTTALDDRATLKTRAYYNRLANLLQSFDDRTQTTQVLGRAFDSPYDDKAYGGSVELALRTFGDDSLALALHYRRDEHNEAQTSRPGLPTSTPEPNQRSVERTWSIAAQNVVTLAPRLSFTAGASFDWRELARADEFGLPPGATGANRLFSYPLRNASAWNAQGRIDWRDDSGSEVHVSLSSRARFPTLFERFSSQFGTAVANPDLKPERATNAEIGASRVVGPVTVSGALFYSWLDDALVSVRTPQNLNRRENIGSADYYGGEISVELRLGATLSTGANYSYIHRSFDIGTPPPGGLIRPFELTDVPAHKGFAYLSWQPVAGLEVVPSAEYASGRTTVTPASANGLAPIYYKTEAYVTAALRVDYDLTDRITIGVGGRNLFDRNYALTDGFPEPGRSFFLGVRARY
ncbi:MULTISPECIES: TonB-dependent receptor plug domain-containing protein [unclassified Sphingopyxis]|uniref:TonB-dependent receptor plug domain-containing protein n=1 Tax=unclassified Sphingopyxis TaxID=2614943 RepID=UPI000736580E|nr:MULTISPECIES: TonB-dependent receptor [unclassified Sphingopyxis]KTE38050.1 TonB-dependent receptor [Sphingopyxis sp. HIX]KTE84641.1 TonB-dependent receptor [Sphingopyxis sp. HXXIV]